MKKAKQYKPKTLSNRKFNLAKTSYKKGYDADWNKYRFRFLHHNPKCYACGTHKDNSKIHVDHIRNAKEFPDMFDNLENHLPLCISCHSTVTQLFEKDRKNMDLDGKLRWINDMRKKTATDVRLKVLPYYKKR